MNYIATNPWDSEIFTALKTASITVTGITPKLLHLIALFKFWPAYFNQFYMGVFNNEFKDTEKMSAIKLNDSMLYADVGKNLLFSIEDKLKTVISNSDVLKQLKAIFGNVPNWFVLLYYFCQCAPEDEYQDLLRSVAQLIKTKGITLRVSNEGKAELLRIRKEQGELDLEVAARVFVLLIKSE